MIKVKNLKKTYVMKNGQEARGILDISFDLGESGFVFVVGKSGSGKSTLLNLIGDIDTPTSGDIIVNGKNIKDFSEKDKNLYKSHYCGFIFQDYKLINELNVYENILLSLEINNDLENADSRIKTLLEKLGLKGYENKNINELSGGEKQRVSIARSLIKNPKIILCDEPTGNLDKKTSTQILDLLKEISKNCLVFIVSHDLKACNKYATRRLVINEGLLIEDSIKDESYKNEILVKNNTLYLPFDHTLNEEEVVTVNQIFKGKNIKEISNIDDGFRPFSDDESNENFSKTPQNSTKISKNLKFKLLKKYLFKGKLSSFINSLIFALLTMLIILVDTFLYFDESDVIFQNINTEYQSEINLTKYEKSNYKGRHTFISFDEVDNENFKDTKYYSFINYTGRFDNALPDLHYVSVGYKLRSKYATNTNKFYPNGFSGTVVVDKDYLNNKFNNGEEVEVLAGDIDDKVHKTGIILTDYLVDAYNDIQKANLTYADFIGEFIPPFKYTGLSFYCNAVIKTNYKIKFKKLYDEYIAIKNNGYVYDDLINFTKTDDYENYINEIVNGDIGVAYTLNPNFLNDVKENDEFCSIMLFADLFLSIDGKTVYEDAKYDYRSLVYSKSKLNDDEIVLSYTYARPVMAQYNVTDPKDIIWKDVYLVKTVSSYFLNPIEGALKLKIVGLDYTTQVNLATKNKLNALHRKEIGRVIPLNEANQKVISKIIKITF